MSCYALFAFLSDAQSKCSHYEITWLVKFVCLFFFQRNSSLLCSVGLWSRCHLPILSFWDCCKSARPRYIYHYRVQSLKFQYFIPCQFFIYKWGKNKGQFKNSFRTVGPSSVRPRHSWKLHCCCKKRNCQSHGKNGDINSTQLQGTQLLGECKILVIVTKTEVGLT